MSWTVTSGQWAMATAQLVPAPKPVLYAIKPDGSGARSLYQGRPYLRYALSPDGRTLALGDAGPEPTHRVEALSTFLYPRAELKSEPLS